eukprot:scaffold131471_cov66-Phaeocystis_antarctica.AAC.2
MTPRLLSHALHALPVSGFLVVSPDQWCATAGADDEVAQMFGPGVTTRLCVGPQLCPSRLQYGLRRRWRWGVAWRGTWRGGGGHCSAVVGALEAWGGPCGGSAARCPLAC